MMYSKLLVQHCVAVIRIWSNPLPQCVLEIVCSHFCVATLNKFENDIMKEDKLFLIITITILGKVVVKRENQLTKKWTIFMRWCLILLMMPVMSTTFSILICSITMSRHINVPVRPTPALQ